MKVALIFAIIGFIGCLYSMIASMKNKKMGEALFNFILVVVDICVILFCTSKLNEISNEAPEIKYSKIEDVVMVNVDSVFTKTKLGVDTTYNIHYKLKAANNYKSLIRIQTNLKHIELDTVFNKTTKGVDTTYIINYNKK